MSQELPGLIYLEKVRLSFPHLAVAHKSGPDADPKFSADFILEPSHPGYAKFMARVQALAAEKWRESSAQMLQYITTDKRLRAYGPGSEVINKETMTPYEGYAGCVYIKANNAIQPALYGADGNPLMNATAIYGGCYVNAQVQPWLQDNAHGKAVRCEVIGVQFHSDGPAFGAAPIDPTTLFGVVGGAQPPQGYPPVQQPPQGYPPVQQPPQGYPPQAIDPATGLPVMYPQQ